MKPLKQKVFAYITQGTCLLVFHHPGVPEAGIQVPSGTVREGEHFDMAVRREVREETGLEDVELVRLLGEQERDMSEYGIPQIHHQQFFHMCCKSSPPGTWQHAETDPDDSSSEHILEFYWFDLKRGLPDLIAEHGRMLPKLIEQLFHLD